LQSREAAIQVRVLNHGTARRSFAETYCRRRHRRRVDRCRPAFHRIVAGPAFDLVIAAAAEQPIRFCIPLDDVVARRADHVFEVAEQDQLEPAADDLHADIRIGLRAEKAQVDGHAEIAGQVDGIGAARLVGVVFRRFTAGHARSLEVLCVEDQI
jgi:hypothetical protein